MHKNNFFKQLSVKVTAKEDCQNGLYTYINPYSYLQIRKNSELINYFTKIYCDGILIVIFLRIVGIHVERKSFDSTSMALSVIKRAANNKNKVFLIGGEQGVAEAAAKYFYDVAPTINICGTRSGYFNGIDDYNSFVSSVCNINPDVIIVGMGAPKQEKMLVDIYASGWKGLGYTCGGYFHQTASSGINYYPNLINKLNMRWAYRIFDEPKLIKRYTIEYGKFIFIFAMDYIKFLYSKISN